jgi:hypothetical protein
MLDISDTLAPNSDQLDAIDLLGGPRTFTITKVSKGNAEQPVQITLAEFPRVWRPGKSMRRVLAACWGTDASVWEGRRLTLYCDESVRFGSEVVGGTRIAALSHIDKPRSVPLLVSRGKSATFKVKPLAETPPRRSGTDEFHPDTTSNPDPTSDAAPPAGDTDAVTPGQMRMLHALLNEYGLGDRETALAWIGLQIGREIDTSKALSKDEASRVIGALNALGDQS